MNWTHSESERQRDREFQSRGKSSSTLYLASAALDLFAFLSLLAAVVHLTAQNDWLFHMVSLVDDNFHLLSILLIHIVIANGKDNLNTKIIPNENTWYCIFHWKKRGENEWNGQNSTDSHNFVVVVKWINSWNHTSISNTDFFHLCVSLFALD